MDIRNKDMSVGVLIGLVAGMSLTYLSFSFWGPQYGGLDPKKSDKIISSVSQKRSSSNIHTISIGGQRGVVKGPTQVSINHRDAPRESDIMNIEGQYSWTDDGGRIHSKDMRAVVKKGPDGDFFVRDVRPRIKLVHTGPRRFERQLVHISQLNPREFADNDGFQTIVGSEKYIY